MCSRPRPRHHTFRFYLLFKQLHVIVNISITVVLVGIETHVFWSVWCTGIESYQAGNHWYWHRLQNKHTDSCDNYNFDVLKPQFVALSSHGVTARLTPSPRYYRENRPHPRGITAVSAFDSCIASPGVGIQAKLRGIFFDNFAKYSVVFEVDTYELFCRRACITAVKEKGAVLF